MKALLLLLVMILSHSTYGQKKFDVDKFNTSSGQLAITFISHGTLMFQWDGKTVHVDPVSQYADYSEMPKADIILITHEHGDHLDAKAIRKILKPGTKVIMTKACYDALDNKSGMDIMVLSNGDDYNFEKVQIHAIPAYNIQNKNADGKPYHPKGKGNGYVISFANKKVLVAGDTENIPEIKALKGIDIAFLPMNLPYTMTPEMVTDAAKAFKPDILYPYHYGKTDPEKLKDLMKDVNGVEVRIRNLE